jgi:FkbM family methyltransferase
MADFSIYDLNPALAPVDVLDLGAFEDAIWPAPYMPLMRAGRAKVVGFEPDLAGCLRLGSKYGPPHRFFPLFVGDGQPARYYATSRVQTGSLFEPNRPLLEVFYAMHELTTTQHVKDVNTVRLDDVTDIGAIDYLKMDIQGSELKALEGGQALLEGVVLIQIEVWFAEMYHGQPLFADIDRFLRSKGFWVHLFPGLDPVTMKPFMKGGRQVLWTDVVYTRHPLQLGTLSDVKLWKLATVLHDIYRSFDFAHACLREIDARTGGDAAARYGARLEAG